MIAQSLTMLLLLYPGDYDLGLPVLRKGSITHLVVTCHIGHSGKIPPSSRVQRIDGA